jgi:hypothetical protein
MIYKASYVGFLFVKLFFCWFAYGLKVWRVPHSQIFRTRKNPHSEELESHDFFAYEKRVPSNLLKTTIFPIYFMLFTRRIPQKMVLNDPNESHNMMILIIFP